MEKSNNINLIKIKYNFITKKSTYTFKELFKPYSGKELLESVYFMENYSRFQSFIVDIDKYDFSFLPDDYYISNDNENNYTSNFSDIVLDSIFTLYFCFDPNGIYFYNLDEIELPVFFVSNSIEYIGLYTELLKTKIDLLKYDISILLNILSNKDISDDQKNNFLNLILTKYSININVSNNQSIINTITNLLCYMSTNRNHLCQIDIDLYTYDTYIQLLQEFKKTNYIYKQQCFCLCRENCNFYFSLSGVQREPDESLFIIIQRELKKIVKKEFNQLISISYCMVSDNTLSYGKRDKNGLFVNFNTLKLLSPISYKKYNESIYGERKIDSFTCCERKIFAGTKDKNGQLYMYCKYEPCERCKPAVLDNAKDYSIIRFFAFAKDYEDCKKKILEKQNLILSPYTYHIYRYL